MARLTYMQRRRSGIYEFRRMLPLPLRGKPAPAHVRQRFPELVNADTGCFKLEISRSLDTTDQKTARRADLDLIRHFDEVFAVVADLLTAPAPTASPAARFPTESELDAIMRGITADNLRWDEEQREGDDRRDRQSPRERSLWPDLMPLALGRGEKGMEDDHFEVHAELVEEELEALRKSLAKGRPADSAMVELREAFRKNGLTFPEGRAYELGLRATRATLAAVEGMAARNLGKEVAAPVEVDAGPKLSAALADWEAGGGARNAAKPAPNSVLEAKAVAARFVEVHGDLPLGEITKAHVREFRALYEKLPKALPAKLRKLPLRELATKDLSAFELRSAATINKGLALLGAIVARAEAEGHLDGVPGFKNPFVGLAIRKANPEEDDRQPFAPSHLKVLFALPYFVAGERPPGGGGEASFWFAPIALLSGLRLRELGGLSVADLRKDETSGAWIFDVRANDHRGLKTETSRRLVPVHPRLEEMGLLAYRAWIVEQQGEGGRLWPDVKSSVADNPTAAWSKWFGRVLRKEAGLTDPGLVFHSFRHTFATYCREAGLDEEQRHALTGHSTGKNVGRNYGTFRVATLAKLVARIPAPVELAGLAWRAP